MPLSEQLEMLRVEIEYAVPSPAIILVSSACKGDGKRVAAAGLAQSMQAAGYATLLVDADPGAPQITGAPQPESMTAIAENGLQRFTFKTSLAGPDMLVLSSENLREGASRETVSMLFAEFRDAYRYVVIDAARVTSNYMALLLAAAANGILLTVRSGRRVRTADKQLANAIAREGIKLLGVVSIASGLIQDAETLATPQQAWHPKVSSGATSIDTARQRATS